MARQAAALVERHISPVDDRTHTDLHHTSASPPSSPPRRQTPRRTCCPYAPVSYLVHARHMRCERAPSVAAATADNDNDVDVDVDK
jgi:hypothetical protein